MQSKAALYTQCNYFQWDLQLPSIVMLFSYYFLAYRVLPAHSWCPLIRICTKQRPVGWLQRAISCVHQSRQTTAGSQTLPGPLHSSQQLHWILLPKHMVVSSHRPMAYTAVSTTIATDWFEWYLWRCRRACYSHSRTEWMKGSWYERWTGWHRRWWELWWLVRFVCRIVEWWHSTENTKCQTRRYSSPASQSRESL